MKKRRMDMKKICTCAIVMISLLCFVYQAWATNGYFTHGHSIKGKGLAGAGAALPHDSIGTAMNPAVIAFVGDRIDFGLSFFNPNREYTVKGQPSGFPGTFGLAPGTVESDSKWFIIPAIGFNKILNEKHALGLSLFANGGMNTDYDTNTFGGSKSTGVDLSQLFIAPTYAIKVHPKHSLGVSFVLAYQSFEARGLEAFGMFSRSPQNLTNNGHENSFGYGARIGYLGEVLPSLFLGVSYQTRIWMDEFNDYKGLFAEQGDFDIPQTWTIGLAYKVTPALVFTADVQKIYYSDVDSVGNPLLPNLQQSPLGSDNGAGFGWDDMTVIKLGAQWQSSEYWTWRAGFSYGEQPIPSSEVLFNIIAPGVPEYHATFGVTKKITENSEIDLAVMRAFEKSVEGPNLLEAKGQQRIELTMDQWEISLGYSWKF
jgi:long-chain fatty acid transport protein